MNSLFIPHQFITLNQYILKERGNRFAASKIKKDETHIAYLHSRGFEFKTPCRLQFTWYVKNKRTDPDNIAFGKKFILDGMVKAGVMPDDTFKHIIGFTDEFIVDKDNVGVKISVSK